MLPITHIRYHTGAYGDVEAQCLGEVVRLSSLPANAYAFTSEVRSPEEFLVGTHATLLLTERPSYSLRAALPPWKDRQQLSEYYDIETPVHYIQRVDTAAQHRSKGYASLLLANMRSVAFAYAVIQRANPFHAHMRQAFLKNNFVAIPVIPDRDISLYPHTLVIKKSSD